MLSLTTTQRKMAATPRRALRSASSPRSVGSVQDRHILFGTAGEAELATERAIDEGCLTFAVVAHGFVLDVPRHALDELLHWQPPRADVPENVFGERAVAPITIKGGVLR